MDGIKVGIDFHREPLGGRVPQVLGFCKRGYSKRPAIAFRIRAAASLPPALLAAKRWQTIVPFQVVIAETERCHGDVMTPHLYEIPITRASLPSRNHMAMSDT